jgi:hypothetical protein
LVKQSVAFATNVTRVHQNRSRRKPTWLPRSLVVFVFLRLNVTRLEELLGRVSQKAVQVAHEPVHVALARRLVDNVLVVIISESATQFLVVHFGLVFAVAPSARDLVGVGQLVLPSVARPADEVLTRLVGEQLQQELPQLDGTAPCRNVRGVEFTRTRWNKNILAIKRSLQKREMSCVYKDTVEQKNPSY